jgi:hypothetical protein
MVPLPIGRIHSENSANSALESSVKPSAFKHTGRSGRLHPARLQYILQYILTLYGWHDGFSRAASKAESGEAKKTMTKTNSNAAYMGRLPNLHE